MTDDPTARPSAASLLALDTDAWAGLLAVALPVVRALPGIHVDPVVKRVAALPLGRLVSGRSRADLAEVLARGPVWAAVEAALPDDAARPWSEPVVTDADAAELGALRSEVVALRDRAAASDDRERSLTAKAATLRAEVDELRRSRDGAEARAAQAESQLGQLRDELAAARADAAAAAQQLATTEERIGREVARTRRRDEGEVAGLREQLRDVRRAREQLQRELTAATDRIAALREAARRPAPAAPEARERTPGGGRRGRPSTLPQDVVAGTREAAEWLVAEGRVLLVDGYNVTRTHRSQLGWPEQRRWLEQATGALARRRNVRATIVWDSSRGTPATHRERSGLLTVRFTSSDLTADDELVLHVELALDPDTPVVVVTDDVELRGRLAQHGVDLLDSLSFTWLL